MCVYSEKMLEHFRHPRNVGEIDGANGVGEIGSTRCGDVVRLYLRIEGGRIAAASFEAFGSGPAIAASSVATVLLRGMKTTDAREVTASEIVEALDGLPSHKRRSAIIVAEAIHAAIDDHERGTNGLSRTAAPVDATAWERDREP